MKSPDDIWMKPDEPANVLTAYQLYDSKFTIEPASKQRDWMTPYVYRCLPMTIANQMGWVIRCPVDFTIEWDGGDLQDAIKLTFAEKGSESWIKSHFGFGIVTFSIPYLFRTPPGYGLIVRGAPNEVKRGVMPLDGFVETDWAEYTFTMNWKITEPNRVIEVKTGEPICMLLPYQLALLEQITPEIKPIQNAPEIFTRFQQLAAERAVFTARPDRQPNEWQKDYFKGMQLPKLNLKPFSKKG